MTTAPAQPDDVDMNAPLNEFSKCHSGILMQLDALAGLPDLVAVANKARQVAADSLAIFRHAVFEHHSEEESELFTAVIRSAVRGQEREQVEAMVERLTAEHRVMESLWKQIEPAINASAKGKEADLDAAVVAELVRSYRRHAQFEEQNFLPLAQSILGRNDNHMAALGLSLHMRHVPQPSGYI